MSKKTIAWSGAALMIVLLGSNARAATVNHDTFDRLLGRYVVADRFVQYDQWHANEKDVQSLRDYVQQLESTDPDKLARNEALAYWINLYNAVTLRLILDHYPVSSIKDLGGKLTSAWEKKLVQVNGRPLSLNTVENEIIRPSFGDPRIHFALNCASMSCPPLSSHAYRADVIEEQLEAVARRAVTDPYWVDLSGCSSYGKGHIALSKIFDWYQDDFGGEKGVRNFLAHYLPGKKLPLQNGRCSLHYNGYDWKLNLPPEGDNSR